MPKPQVHCALDLKTHVGECPIWSRTTGTLFFIDIRAPAIYAYNPADGTQLSWPMPRTIGSMALVEGSYLLVALDNGCFIFDPTCGLFAPFSRPEAPRAGNRLNDGRCDRAGRFWVGSMGQSGSLATKLDVLPPPSGELYCVTSDGSAASRVDGLRVSNGLAFSPDDRTLYLSDSHPAVRTIWAFDFDLDDGALRNRRVFVDMHAHPGRPDGAAVDADGCYWTAAAEGWCLLRFTPAGRLDRRIEVPVARPSMPAFGGDDLQTLYFTSIRATETDLDRQPQAGGLFRIDGLGVTGMVEPAFHIDMNITLRWQLAEDIARE